MQTYNNYFQHHWYWADLEINSSDINRQMDKKFGKYMKPDVKVLEIGTWLWNFAHYCIYKHIQNYVGIEVDGWVAEKLWKQFDTYTIHCIDALDYFNQTEEKFDMIFMSHVFEHFPIDDWIILAKLIAQHLTPHGVWINVMPNAGNISGCLARYNDITHKTLYTSNSFNQVLMEAWYNKSQIEHFNVWPRSFLKKIIAYILWKLIAIPYHTFELMSVIYTDNRTKI